MKDKLLDEQSIPFFTLWVSLKSRTQWKTLKCKVGITASKGLYLWSDVLKEERLTLIKAFYGFVCQTWAWWGYSTVKDNEFIKVGSKHVNYFKKERWNTQYYSRLLRTQAGVMWFDKCPPLPTSLHFVSTYFFSSLSQNRGLSGDS